MCRWTNWTTRLVCAAPGVSPAKVHFHACVRARLDHGSNCNLSNAWSLRFGRHISPPPPDRTSFNRDNVFSPHLDKQPISLRAAIVVIFSPCVRYLCTNRTGTVWFGPYNPSLMSSGFRTVRWKLDDRLMEKQHSRVHSIAFAEFELTAAPNSCRVYLVVS